MRPPGRRYFENLVYRTLYPTPDSKDPRNFDEFVRQFIVKEVRLENVRYYGSEADRDEEIDALYPGHDYWSTASRTRLSQFPFHRWLFEVFDDLRLTRDEIEMLCTWEGTKSAKERYEAEKGTKIADLAWDSLPEPPRRTTPTVIHHNLPNRHKRNKARAYLVTPTKPPKRDYYGDPHIWGNFNTSPTPLPRGRDRTVVRGPIIVPQATNPPITPESSSRSDPYQEWLGIMRRAGSHGIYSSPTNSWSPTDVLRHYPPVVVPAHGEQPNTPTPASAYNYRRIVPTSESTTLYTMPPQTLPSARGLRAHLNNARNLMDRARGLPGSAIPPSRDQMLSRIARPLEEAWTPDESLGQGLARPPLAAYRYHSRISDATIEALARTLGG